MADDMVILAIDSGEANGRGQSRATDADGRAHGDHVPYELRPADGDRASEHAAHTVPDDGHPLARLAVGLLGAVAQLSHQLLRPARVALQARAHRLVADPPQPVAHG